ncbi:DUF2207 domain-containing protein [Candidatus Saccharibacteria bacterium]|nr:DUF2207 domain-containing protein [Candidatus Saccharibacteria bacterium]MCL1962862.1 DUF2207 domain-containing protein [Candidatus Saccharibacteria bacterium]
MIICYDSRNLNGWVIDLMTFLGSIGGNMIVARRIKHQFKKIAKTAKHTDYAQNAPHGYSVGVLTVLMDYNVEFKKDIVAAILSLCGRGYLHMINFSGVYQLRINHTKDSRDLSWDDQYIMNCLAKNAPIEYHVWSYYAKEVALGLGLIADTADVKANKPWRIFLANIRRSRKEKESFLSGKPSVLSAIKFLLLLILATIGLIALTAVAAYLGWMANVWWRQASGRYITQEDQLILVLCFPPALTFLVAIAKKNKLSYVRTHLGDQHLREWLLFYNFLNRFDTMFNYDTLENVLLWQEYLAYAQVFGLSKKILGTGYKDLQNGHIKKFADNFKDFSRYLSGKIKR